MKANLFAYPEQKYGLRFKEANRPVLIEDFDKNVDYFIEDKETKMILWDNKKKAILGAQTLAYQYEDIKVDMPAIEIIHFIKKYICEVDFWEEKWSRLLIPEIDFDYIKA